MRMRTPETFTHSHYVCVSDDRERDRAIFHASRQGLVWVSSAYVNGQTRMRFGKYVEARKSKIPYQGKEYWNDAT